MQVLKIVAEGAITSFRYPHFMQGVQPTYEMPPPATLYGHIASALGEWFDPQGVQFAICFSFLKRAQEVESTILLSEAGGKLEVPNAPPKVLEGNVNPFTREVLFEPRMTLYLNQPQWKEAFLHPRYAVALGRSQDLFFYREVSLVNLIPVSSAYLENTLLPYSMARRIGRGQVVTMPRLLDLEHKRKPSFERYLVLRNRSSSKEWLSFPDDPPLQLWADPQSVKESGDEPQGIIFLTWSPEENGNPTTLA